MPSVIPPLVQNADDENCTRRDGVIDGVTVDEERAVARTHCVPVHTEFRVVRQRANAFVEFVEIFISLSRILGL